MIKALHIEPAAAGGHSLRSLLEGARSQNISFEFSDDMETGLRRVHELGYGLLVLDEGLVDGELEAIFRHLTPLENAVQVFAFSNSSPRIERHRRCRRRLREALDGRELFLDYQPQLDIGTGRLVGVEALVRWRRGDGRIVAPGDFIPVAEEVGLIEDLGAWVLEEACRQSRRWSELGLESPPVAVNVSAKQLAMPSFPGLVERLLERYELPAERLDLELTESLLLSKGSGVRESIRRLRRLGVRFSIDDLGTGYASLEYVRSLPVHRIKIAREFTQRVTRSVRDAAIVTALIGLGRQLGLKVLAEGVEREDQLAFLVANGCDEAQGFLLGRPAAPAALAAWLRRH